MADDDSFIRVEPLRAFLGALDADRPLAVGRPVPSADVTPWSLAHWGPSHHCSGNGWVLSRAAMKALRPKLDECVTTPHVIISWFFDEVQLGRCLHAMGIECVEPASVAHSWLVQRNQSLFVDWTKADGSALLDGATRLAHAPIKFHPVLPVEQATLRATFTDQVDARWVRKFKANDSALPGSVAAKGELLRRRAAVSCSERLRLPAAAHRRTSSMPATNQQYASGVYGCTAVKAVLKLCAALQCIQYISQRVKPVSFGRGPGGVRPHQRKPSAQTRPSCIELLRCTKGCGLYGAHVPCTMLMPRLPSVPPWRRCSRTGHAHGVRVRSDRDSRPS
eukprot:2772399-Prymnesium_polylepis.1